MEKLRKGQKVKISNPVSIAARFWSQDHGGIVGAGYKIIDRQLLEGDAWVFCTAHKCNDRGLIVFGSPDSNNGMWLDAINLEPRK